MDDDDDDDYNGVDLSIVITPNESPSRVVVIADTMCVLAN
jgi:hypothetical protein